MLAGSCQSQWALVAVRGLSRRIGGLGFVCLVHGPWTLLQLLQNSQGPLASSYDMRSD
jgi:hypothetical protein